MADTQQKSTLKVKKSAPTAEQKAQKAADAAKRRQRRAASALKKQTAAALYIQRIARGRSVRLALPDATLACESPRNPADIPSPVPTDTLKSLRAEINARGSKSQKKFASRIKDTDADAEADLSEIIAELPKQKKSSKKTDAEIADALRKKRIDALKSKLPEFPQPIAAIITEFDIEDADTELLEGVANQLLIDFLQKIKTDTKAPRAAAQMLGDISVDFGEGADTFSTIKAGGKPKCGFDTEMRYIKKSSRGGVHFKPLLRAKPINKVVGCCAALKWDFQNHIFQKDADGIWTQKAFDFGSVPCNAKTADGQFCSTHQNCKKAVTEWAEGDFDACGLCVQ